MPFKKLPRQVIKAAVGHIAMWLNAFPVHTGVSRIYSPRTILTGTTVSQGLHCRLPFGSYAEVHDDPRPTNDTGI